MRKLLFLLAPTVFFSMACNNQGKKEGESEKRQTPFDLFTPVKPDFTTTTVILPEGWKYEVLFSEKKDSVKKADGSKHPAKGMHDFTAYIPLEGSNIHGYLYVNHETGGRNDNLGDGGGGTIFEVELHDGRWQVIGDFRHIDFSTVGGTLRNCGGTVTPQKTILTAEEAEPENNKALHPLIRDTSDYNGMKRYLNYGWMVEVDPFSGKAMRKIYAMGRFQHEDAYCDPDGRTVYLTDDNNPAVFFKFIAAAPGDYSSGQLYAYRQSDDGASGEWLALPMTMDSLVKIRNVAIRMGATLFIRHEWIDGTDGKIFITETGSDYFDWTQPIAMGGKPANYFDKLKKEENKYADLYGRILVFDAAANKMRVFLEGGTSPADSTLNFANPDGLCIQSLGGKNYLVISEDLNGISSNRVSRQAFDKGETYNEIYFLELSTEHPTLDDLHRFMAAPRGCETTGSSFTPDGSSYFVSIQHPDEANPEPFNTSAVIAIVFNKPVM
ncbi:MAG TPA: alkaline phosphatase PhoX [Chitinophagales bacterium]|nr:alkaline phosphatase PhoX [Chitinophagales bacterium]